jgi:hypothetical protein
MPKGGATPRNYQYQQKTRNPAAALRPAAIHGSIHIDGHDTTTNELTLLAIAKSENKIEGRMLSSDLQICDAVVFR